MPVLLRSKIYENYFYVLGVIDYEEDFLIHGFTAEEINYANEIIEANKDNLRLFLFKNIRRHLKIKNLKNNQQLKIALENAMLQALSSNYIDNDNGWIHSLVYGPPGSGKNFIARVIELINMESREGQSGKISTAGLLSSCIQRNGKFISDPGLLVLAQNGVFFMKDFHSVDEPKKKLMFGILSRVMQEGFVSDSSASKTTFKTPTGIHFDSNKLSQIRSMKENEALSVYNNFGIESQILTRYDFIMDMNVDSHVRYQTARKSLEQSEHDCEVKNPERIFKLVFAMLRQKYFNIEIPKDVIKTAQARIGNFYKDNESLFNEIPELIDFPQRMMTSVQKYLHAIARLNSRAYSTIEDVEYVMELLSPKLDFLKNYAPKLQADGMLGKESKTIICQQYIIKYFGNRLFTITEAVEAMSKSENYTISRNISERTVRRYVEAVSDKCKHGYWKIKKQFIQK